MKVELSVVGEDAGGCTVAARTRLPRGIYVDPYEMASLQQHNLTKVTTPKLRYLAKTSDEDEYDQEFVISGHSLSGLLNQGDEILFREGDVTRYHPCDILYLSA